jgi:Uma2 family endonuclease
VPDKSYYNGFQTTSYANRNNVYVAGNNFLYYLQGRPRAVVSPDCYVVFGVQKHQRKSYKSWEENHQFPSVVFEITSAATREDDIERKFALYQDTLGIPEYFLFDPTGDYIPTLLVGYTLAADGYVLMQSASDGRLHSTQVGLDLIVEGNRLRLFDPARGIYLLTSEEAQEQTEIATRVAETAVRRAELEAARTQQESKRADAEKSRADQESERANALEAQLAEARARLEELQRQIQEATSLQRNPNAPNEPYTQ